MRGHVHAKNDWEFGKKGLDLLREHQNHIPAVDSLPQFSFNEKKQNLYTRLKSLFRLHFLPLNLILTDVLGMTRRSEAVFFFLNLLMQYVYKNKNTNMVIWFLTFYQDNIERAWLYNSYLVLRETKLLRWYILLLNEIKLKKFIQGLGNTVTINEKSEL